MANAQTAVEGIERRENSSRCERNGLLKWVIKIVSVIFKGTSRSEPNLLPWGPRLDGDFLPKDFPALIHGLAKSKPALIGVTEREAIYFSKKE
jgi:hypothetical protein